MVLGFYTALWLTWTDEESWGNSIRDKLEIIFSMTVLFAAFLPFWLIFWTLFAVPSVLLIVFSIVILILVLPLAIILSISVSIIYALQLSAEAHGEPGALTAGLYYVGGFSLLVSGLCEFLK